MAGLDVVAIHEALADQLRTHIDREFTVRAWPMSDSPRPKIELWPGNPYVTYWSSMGATGTSDLTIEIRWFLTAGNPETAFRRQAELLSVGTGHGASIAAAVRVDKTLGGAVADAYPREATWDIDEDDGGLTGSLPVEIIVNKIGGPG